MKLRACANRWSGNFSCLLMQARLTPTMFFQLTSRIRSMRLLNVSQRKYRLDGHSDTVLCKPPEEQRQIRSEVFGAPV